MLLCRHGAVLALLVTAAFFTGCRFDGTGTKMQWAPDMADSPAPKAQRTFLDPPEGSVAMGAYFYEKDATEAEKTVHMPDWIANDPNVEAKGKVLFETFCSVCHGLGAQGDGTLGAVFPTPPNLTLDVYKNRADGFFFHTISFGGAIMPSYAYAISVHERWMIVKHLRTLQAAAQ